MTGVMLEYVAISLNSDTDGLQLVLCSVGYILSRHADYPAGTICGAP